MADLKSQMANLKSEICHLRFRAERGHGLLASRLGGRSSEDSTKLRLTSLDACDPISVSLLCSNKIRHNPGEAAEVMRVLVVEDDHKIASFIVKGLKQAGFAVDHAADGEDGLHLSMTEPYDVAVIDIMLPKLDGLSLVERLRRQKINTPVIILSAKRSVDDRIKGLQTGSDDYLTKPFSFSELLARIQALIRRASSVTEPARLTVGEVSLDLLTREVLRGRKKIDLQPREFALLEYLMRHAGRILSKSMIMEHVWGYDFDPQTNVVDVLVCRLRIKIDREFERKLIHTHRGVGYALKIS